DDLPVRKLRNGLERAAACADADSNDDRRMLHMRMSESAAVARRLDAVDILDAVLLRQLRNDDDLPGALHQRRIVIHGCEHMAAKFATLDDIEYTAIPFARWQTGDRHLMAFGSDGAKPICNGCDIVIAKIHCHIAGEFVVTG